jgi:hypothetical protein
MVSHDVTVPSEFKRLLEFDRMTETVSIEVDKYYRTLRRQLSPSTVEWHKGRKSNVANNSN